MLHGFQRNINCIDNCPPLWYRTVVYLCRDLSIMHFYTLQDAKEWKLDMNDFVKVLFQFISYTIYSVGLNLKALMLPH